MKIAFIGQKGIPVTIGGVERRVEELSVRMAKQGHQVFVYARKNYSQRKQYKGVRLIYVPFFKGKNFEAISHTFFATWHAIFSNYDIIHYQAPGPTTLAWLVRLFRPDVKVVATFNSRDCKHKKWGFLAQKYLQLGEWAICHFPHKTIAVSGLIKDYAKKKYDKNLIEIENGASVSKVATTKNLQKFNLEKGKYLLYLGRLVKHKRVHDLVEVFIALKNEGKIKKDLKLAIVGEGAYTHDYVRDLKQRAQNRSDIVFTGKQEGLACHEFYSHALIFVSASESEGLSNSLLEAMGHGLPILVADIPENTNVVADTARLFVNKDREDFKNNLGELILDKNKQRLLAQSALRRAREKYDWQKVTEKNLAVYNQLIKKPHEKTLTDKNISTKLEISN